MTLAQKLREKTNNLRALPPGTRFRLRVPASSANLGPGFDVYGLALALYNYLEVEVIANEIPSYLTIEGSEATGLPSTSDNLAWRSLNHLFKLSGIASPSLHLKFEVNIPHGRGLGSSSTAVVAGLTAANMLLGEPLTALELLEPAIELEQGNHPDNVAPALLGGLVVNVAGKEGVSSIRLEVDKDLKAIVYIPDFKMDTIAGRALMPHEYGKSDLIFNMSRTALFIAALTTKRFDLLAIAMEDKVHQPYREQIFPAMPAFIASAIRAGARGASLSGGGSTIIALSDGDSNTLARIREVLEETGKQQGLSGRSQVLTIDQHGAQL